MTKKISSRSREVSESIRDLVPFNTYGALRGEAIVHPYVHSGRLNDAERDALTRDLESINYVVWSYATPIAWHSVIHGWHKVEQKFSMTTSHHQGRLYLI